ncbi:NAD(P)/FAD-dependent oxidoreductase [Paenactinomyces guangxiensis]|uniref:Ferredoxin--NADP reductase n=1 Tax=Paenactinomyces guangxiensis TaxID=1490290 RepID=A0A7W2A8F1_9BACL|nr:NAD(P)/FAD-dependent oxidoreductase [Paenactinomyces guangxiensis]MBA4493758.1 NAD(P)/FAD-dependent oxidoreductase [Paenactinomyces guangxiensis]MBH8591046.1 NAD(P)/FAD-dependent oxidoreductase [Paenactinomyces guangxiensis]
MTAEHIHNNSVSDIIVIGGGPTGLFAAFYAGMRKASVKVIESMPQLGGQLSALYPEKYIYDVAGFPKVAAQELVDNLVEQASLFKPEYFLNEKVLRVNKKEEQLFEVVTQKQTHLGKSVIITAGCGAFEPRKLDLPGSEQFESSNLHYFVTDKQQFANQDVLIAGGGDSAVDWALMLEPIAKSVTIIHRRDKFRAHEHSVEKMMNSTVKVITPREIESLHGEERIEKVTIVDKKSGLTEDLDVDAVIVSFGFISSLGPIKEWGLELDNGGIKVNSKMETNIPGIYAAGDIATYPGKVKLIAVGFGEAPTAVNNAKQYMDPNARLQPGHSSNMKF